MTENQPTDSAADTQAPLAVRRLRKLTARPPDATPACLAERLGGIFVRDFTLVGSAQAGATELTPNLVGTVTRNRRVAGLTQAATHLGAVQQGIATYNRAATSSINTTAHVGSAQAVKTYLHGIALIYGLDASTSDAAAVAILGREVNDLLAQLESAPRAGQSRNQTNVLGAVAALGLRNPQTLLLVKAGEQLVKAGGAVFASQKVRRDFARQLIEQVQQNLGDAPAQLPAATAALLAESPAEDGTDLRELTEAEVTSIETGEMPSPLEPSRLQAPQRVEASSIDSPAPVTAETPVRASTESELQSANGAAAKGARLAARAFVRARSRFQ